MFTLSIDALSQNVHFRRRYIFSGSLGVGVSLFIVLRVYMDYGQKDRKYKRLNNKCVPFEKVPLMGKCTFWESVCFGTVHRLKKCTFRESVNFRSVHFAESAPLQKVHIPGKCVLRACEISCWAYMYYVKWDNVTKNNFKGGQANPEVGRVFFSNVPTIKSLYNIALVIDKLNYYVIFVRTK
jgi:hypothetical protein